MATAVRLQTVRYGGSEAALARMLASLGAGVRSAERQGRPVELTVALGDCGAPGGAEATLPASLLEEAELALKAAGAAFEYEAFGANLGHGAAQNRLAGLGAGVARPAGELLVVANPDTYLTPDCLFQLVRVLEDESAGIAEGRQIPLEHPKPFDPATGETPWASGCLMALRSSLFVALGGFEPAFFLHGDDVDLSWRMRLQGLTVRHVPEAAVFHDKRLSESGFPAPSPEEEYQAMLARFLLAHRAEREDVIDWWLEWAKVHASPLQAEAVAEFERRRTAGALPRVYREALGVSAEHVARVATFVGGEYAQHRF